MDAETKNKIDRMDKEIQELKQWKAERIAQQITDPLDIVSQKILGKYFLAIVRTFTTLGAGSREFTSYIARQGKDGFRVSSEVPIYEFQADATTDYLTIRQNVLTDETGSYPDGTEVVLFTNGTLPSPLSSAINYFVVSSTGNKVKLSLTLGGSAINITDAGTGEHYIQQY